jgi:hypothetical protein
VGDRQATGYLCEPGTRLARTPPFNFAFRLHGSSPARVGARAAALFVALLVDATTAGRLAQASRVCKELLKPRLVALRAGLRLAAQARREELRQRKRAAVLQLFEVVDGGAFYRCMAHVWSGGTPCGKHLHVARSGSLSRLMCHLQQYHADEYRAAMLACDMISLEQR